MTPRHWALRLVAILDLIALSTLALTQEVRYEFMGVVLLAYIVSRLVSYRLSRGALILGLLMMIGLGITAFFGFRIHPTTAAAFAAPAFHALLWYRKEDGALGWRIGLGFMELVLATALTADLYLSISITLFALIASVAIACDFLDQQLSARGSKLASAALPQGFVSRTLRASLLIVVASGILFPILPRMKSNFGLSQDYSRVGYTEEVSLSDWTRLSGTQGGSVVMWLYPKNETMDLKQTLHLGLFRGKTMEIFDGKSWNPDPRKSARDNANPSPPSRTIASTVAPVSVEVVRGPLRSDILPIPYGTQKLRLLTSDGSINAPRLKTGEWIDRSSYGQKVRYELEFKPFQLEGVIEIDQPTQSHLFIPQSVRTERFQRLADRLFRGATDPRSKLDRVNNFFKEEKFKAAPEGTEDITLEASNKAGFSPLEHFLLIGKQGHCEWFASSTALLLRAAGVPTRLVAGFRVTQSPTAGVLTVRNSDAHAWIEYWIEGRGWMPADPSPRRVATDTPWWDSALVAYDVAAGYWFRYILSFEDAQDPLAPPKTFKMRARDQLKQLQTATFENTRLVFWFMLAGAVLIAGWIGYHLRRGKRAARNWEGKGPLRRERLRLERLLQKSDDASRARASQAIARWENIYTHARFGNSNPVDSNTIEELKNARSQVRELISDRRHSA